MNVWKACACSAALILNSGFLSAEAPSALRFRVLPLGERGVVEDLAPGDWKVTLGGRDAKVLSQRLPKELGLEAQKWVFIFLPVRDAEYRRMMVRTVATFMSTLPATDSALLVMNSAKGTEWLTPGFTTRPSLWEKALGRVLDELPARLAGTSDHAFSIPASPNAEKEEGMEPIQAFLAGLDARKLEKRADDVTNQRSSVLDSYSPDSLGSNASAVVANLASLERVFEALGKGDNDKQIVVFSRNEIDDLANPVWRSKVNTMSVDRVLNAKLQAEMMIRDVTLARMSLSSKLNKLGLTLHSVGSAGASYTGAFGEAAASTGGYQFRFGSDLATRLSQLLPLWATRYELEVELSGSVSSPTKITAETTRKNIQVFAPTSR